MGANERWTPKFFTPSTVGTTNTEGTDPREARADHIHAHEAAHVAHDTIFDAKGDLVAGTGADAASKLTVGADDTILMADAAQATGLKWVASGTPGAIDASGGAGTADTFARGDHTHLHEAAHINHDTTWAAKGDIIAGSANDTAIILTVGANDTILMADSAAASGLKWVADAAPVAVSTANSAGTSDDFSRASHVHAHEVGHVVHDTIWDAAGDLAIGTGADTAARLGIGGANTILTSNGTTATWATNTGDSFVTKAKWMTD